MNERTKMRPLVLFLMVFLFALPAVGADAWQPPEPDDDQFDWIRMSSGEWLGGELKHLRDLDLEFDSDELDLLKLDWGDVVEFRSSRFLTLRFENLGTISGTVAMKDDVVAVRTESGVTEFPRSALVLIVEGKPKEINYWSAKATFGIANRSGNTKQTDINTNLRIRRQSPGTRSTLDYTGNYGTVSDETTIKNNNLTASIDAQISRGFFVTPLSLNFVSDEFQNLDLKSTVSAGLGYVISRGGKLEWDVGLSAGYQTTTYISVAEGEDRKTDNASLIPSTELEWDITGDIELLVTYNAQIGLPETKNTFHHGRAAISFDILGDIIDLDWAITWDRAESPRPDADGNTPLRDDVRTTFGIGVDW